MKLVEFFAPDEIDLDLAADGKEAVLKSWWSPLRQ